MKTVFNNRMVAHVWAQQSQPEGHGSNFFFDGPVIYSYGRHFPIAAFVQNAKKARAVLFTDRGYSVSTFRHISYTRQALRGDVPVFSVRHVFDGVGGMWSHKSNMEAFAKDLELALALAAKPRIRANTRDAAVTDAQRIVARSEEYANFFALKKSARLKAPDFAPGYIERIRAEASAAHEKAARKVALLEKAAFAKAAVELQEWLDGVPRECPRLLALTDNKSARLVVSKFGDVVKTSLGAEVPLADARRAVAFIQACRTRGRSWERNGETCPVGLFQIDTIDASGNIKAGCHRIDWSEIARILPALEG